MPVADIEADIQEAAKGLKADDFLKGVRTDDAADADDGHVDAPEADQEAPPERDEGPSDAAGDVDAGTDDDDLDPPAEWTAAEQDVFRKLPKEGKDAFLKFHERTRTERDEVATEAERWQRDYGDVDEVLAPVEDALRANGLTKAQYVRSLHAASQRLATDPAGFIRQIAAQKGIDLRQLVAPEQPPAEEEYIDPVVRAIKQETAQELAALRQEVQRLNGGFNGWQQQAEAQAQAQVTSEITQFASATDERGKPLRPYFNEVKADMGVLMDAALRRGEHLTLDQAYERAVWANPDTRAKFQAAETAAAQRKAEREARDRSERARRAGSSVVGEGAGANMTPEIPTDTALQTALAVARRSGYLT